MAVRLSQKRLFEMYGHLGAFQEIFRALSEVEARITHPDLPEVLGGIHRWQAACSDRELPLPNLWNFYMALVDLVVESL